jgi:hypothetical protein
LPQALLETNTGAKKSQVCLAFHNPIKVFYCESIKIIYRDPKMVEGEGARADQTETN